MLTEKVEKLADVMMKLKQENTQLRAGKQVPGFDSFSSSFSPSLAAFSWIFPLVDSLSSASEGSSADLLEANEKAFKFEQACRKLRKMVFL